MLPTETFAEAIAFLRLVDLGALVIANTLCSSLAVKASTTIRFEEFHGLLLSIWNRSIEVSRRFDSPDDEGGSITWQWVAALNFSTEGDTAEFVVAAFPSCILGDLAISSFVSERLLDAVGRIADCVIVKGFLRTPGSMSPDNTLRLVRMFRKVKALQLMRAVRKDDVSEIVRFYRGNGIHELYCCRSLNDWTPKKLAVYF